MLGKPANPMIDKAEMAIEAKVPAKFKGALAKVVHAGLTIMYAPSLKETMMHRIATSTSPAQDAGQGAARLVVELDKQSKGTMPQALRTPAAMLFAFEYLDLVAKVGKVQITPQLISDATQATGDALLTAMGVKQQQLQQMIAAKGGGKSPGLINAPQGV